MAIRSTILETRSGLSGGGYGVSPTVSTGTITLTSGLNTLTGAATTFTVEYVVGDVFAVIDDAGRLRMYTIDTILSNTSATIVGTAWSTTTTKAYSRVNPMTPYIVGSDPATSTITPNKYFIYQKSTTNQLIELGSPLIVSDNTDSIPIGVININEGITVESFYVTLPFQYTMSDSALSVKFYYVDANDSNSDLITVLGGSNSQPYLTFPVENAEIPLNIFIPPPPVEQYPDGWLIYCKINVSLESQLDGASAQSFADTTFRGTQSTVSAVNEPASLAGEFMGVKIGIRVRHTYPITGIPQPPPPP
jgi:hypothetical protein